jgi:gliding motility-associated protein GldM
MAGGKETPRQKMIGMMYLVLTALLALQVSNAVLEKFAIIESTLSELINDQNNANTAILTAIVDKAGKSPNSKIVKARDAAQKVRDLTRTTLTTLDKLKAKFLTVAGSDKIDERIINDHSSKVAAMMMTQPDGKEYEKLLNDYVVKLREYSGMGDKQFPGLAKPPREHELFKDDEKNANKDFLTFTFENTPVIAALASVTQTETEILEYEAKALEKLRDDAEAGTVRFDNYIPMVRPVSSVVAAGATYEADMFISASSSSFNPDMFRDGAKLEVYDSPEGLKMGKVKFTASGGSYDANGLAKKSFKAEIKLPDTTLTRTIDYFVAQPIIRVTTGNAPTLYMNCGNNVNIEVPSLGANYNPNFSCTAAEIRKGDKPGKVTIIPSARKISVNVSNGATPLGAQPFDVKNVPDPRFIAYIGNQQVDLSKGIKAAQIRSLRVVAEPEENFKEEVPKDARYTIKNMEITMGSGANAKAQMRATNGSPDLGAWANNAKAGDRVVFVVKDAIRKTFTDSEEKVNIKGSNGVIFVQIVN